MGKDPKTKSKVSELSNKVNASANYYVRSITERKGTHKSNSNNDKKGSKQQYNKRTPKARWLCWVQTNWMDNPVN